MLETLHPVGLCDMASKMRHPDLLTSTWRPPSLGLPSIQYTLPIEDAIGAPSLMLWLVISSLDTGVIQSPTGASCDAIFVQSLLLTTRLLVARACFDLHNDKQCFSNISDR